MLVDKLLTHGRRDFQNYYKDTKVWMFGIWMRRHAFGVRCLIVDLPQKGSQCKGGKKAKQRITVALIANACGGREKAIVIWKSEKPRYFKGIDVNQLPVKYFSQSKAWMTGNILDTILSKINRQLSTKN